MKEILKKYLDNSPDCDTIILELQDSYELEQLYKLADLADYNDNCLMFSTGLPFKETNEHVQWIFSLIRNVWDIAYNHGYQDAQADSGLTLIEQED